ncbi:MAG: AraC family transcriptional regulator [Cyanobacteria bacterium P01_G01_bin.54]
MTITFRNNELYQLLETHAQNTQPELLVDHKDRTLIYPDWLGTGYKRDIRLPGGLSLTLHRRQLKEEVILDGPEVQRNCFEFMFVMTGKAEINRQVYRAEQEVFLVSSIIPAGRVLEFAGELSWAVDIHIDIPLLTTMVAEYEATIPTDVYRLVMREDDNPGLAPRTITPTMQALLQQILQCSYQGLTRSLFLQAKSLELIALYLQATPPDKTQTSRQFKAHDIESLYHAKDILQQNLHTPPSLMELARQVGINDRKLKQGFRELFDTTVFGYLTQQRMEAACQLLQQQRHSVAAVAATVGYNSPTAFSGAFRRKFGITPKAYQLANGR